MVTGQALLGVLKQHGGVPSMWPNDVMQQLLHVYYSPFYSEKLVRVISS